jgi:hypothetical protein
MKRSDQGNKRNEDILEESETKVSAKRTRTEQTRQKQSYTQGVIAPQALIKKTETSRHGRNTIILKE